ncbi:MAG: hypothetical protein NTX47_00130 [Candidatus Omnitrophica bacterium]|nr:hypothetical protein [Candidatus Omnitrophota bacterium]
MEVVGNIISKGTSWTIRVSNADNAWLRSVTYGNGLFVAVSDSPGTSAMTSPDGINWTARTTPNGGWFHVTYGNGMFVATGYNNNNIMSSPDGINWTARTTSVAGSWPSVTYGNGLFVAVGRDATTNGVITSPDGITWTGRTSAAAIDYEDVTYGNGLFVAVAITGTGNRVMTSPDGITWTSRTSASDNNWWSVTYGNGLFVAVAYSGTGNRVMTSPDGITWTSRTSAADNDWRCVTYGDGLFVATAESGTGNRVMTSPDGINWTIRTSAADNNWRSVVYGNGMFVAVGHGNGTTHVMTSGKTEITTFAPNNTYQGGMNIFGNVGIGTTAPAQKLDVAGSVLQKQLALPPLVGSYDTADTHNAFYFQVVGKYAYIVMSDGGIAASKKDMVILDVSNPASPILVGSLDDDTNFYQPSCIQVVGKYAYVTNRHDNTVPGKKNFIVIDVSNPAAPTVVGGIDDDVNLYNAFPFAISGKYAYVGNYQYGANKVGFTVIDISNPITPVIVGTLLDNTDLYAPILTLKVVGKYVYVANDAWASGNSSITIIDVSNPSAPSKAGRIGGNQALTQPRYFEIAGKYLYTTLATTSAANNKLTVLDISNPASPSVAAGITDNVNLYNARGLAMAGKYLFVGSNTRQAGTANFTVIDISNPLSPTVVCAAQNDTTYGRPQHMQVVGKYLYTAFGDTGEPDFRIYDISGLDAPSASIGNIATNAINVEGDAIVNNNLYVKSGLNVGPSGAMFNGPISVQSTTSPSFFAGNVGIGTTAPTTKLSIVHNSSNPIDFYDGSSVLAGNIFMAGGTSRQLGFNMPGATGASSTGDNWTLLRYGDAANKIFLGDTGSVSWIQSKHSLYFKPDSSNAPNSTLIPTMVITNAGTANGNVGIGTTDPTAKLHVGGTSGVDGIRFPDGTLQTTAGGGGGGQWTTSGNNIYNANSGNVGIGTTAPVTKLQVNSKVTDDNAYSYDSNSTYLIHQTATSTTVLNDPKTVLLLARQGTGGQAYGAAAAFNLSRYENNGVNSRTRLDISLANASFDVTSNNVMTLLSSGYVGIGTTNPPDKFSVLGDVNISSYGYAGNGRATLWLGALPSTWDNSLVTDDATGRLDFMKDNGNGVASMTILQSGNVGIGTTAPLGRLHVADSAWTNTVLLERSGFTTDTFATAVRVLATKTSNMGDGFGPVINFTIQDDAAAINTIGDFGVIRDGNDQSGAFVWNTRTVGTINERMRITNTGNVGIGTTAPTSQLHLYRSALNTNTYINTADGVISATEDGAARPNNFIHMYDNWGSADFAIKKYDVNIVAFFAGAGDDLYLGANDTPYLNIKAGGNVGIGTTAPVGALEVNSNTNPQAVIRQYFDTGSADLWLKGSLNSAGWKLVAQGANYATSPNALSFRYNDSSKILFDSSGNVGIGTTAPFRLLDLNNTTGISQAHITKNGTDDGGYITSIGASNFFLSGGTAYDASGTNWTAKNASASILGANEGAVKFYTDTGLTPGVSYAPSLRMTIDNAGNVGIGTTAPGRQLEIYSASNANMRIYSNTAGSTGAGIFFRNNGSTAGSRNFWVGVGNDTALRFRLYSDNDATFSDLMYLTSTGSVGINTTAPEAKLEVAGTLKIAGAGDANIANDLYFENITSSNIKSYGPLMIQSGNSNSNYDLTLKGTGSGTVYVDGPLRLSQISAPSPTTDKLYNVAGSLYWNGTALGSGGSSQWTGTNPIYYTAGNVGIGTTAPIDKLHVTGGDVRIGSPTVSNASGSPDLFVQGNLEVDATGYFDTNLIVAGNVGIGSTSPQATLDLGTGTGRRLYIYNSGTVRAGFGIDLVSGPRELSIFHPTAGTDGFIAFGSQTDGTTTFTERMRLTGAGYVGIGTNAPLSPLYISTTNDAYTNLANVANYSTVFKLQTTSTGVGQGIAWSAGTNPNVGAAMVFKRTDLYSKGQLEFYTKQSNVDAVAPSLVMVLSDAGSVGIGETTIATGKLAVSGTNGYAESGINLKVVARFSGDANNAIVLNSTSANSSGYNRGFEWSYTGDDFGISRFASNGTGSRINDFFISTTGNVGIGATSPVYKLQVAGSFAATYKNFEITHPLDPNKILTHSSIEGPEHAVYYRGEAQLVNSEAVITLPDYFEALTRKENRTVQLTPIKGFSLLYVSEEVMEGKFKVRAADGGNPSQRFYWEVKAVRADIPELVAEKEKPKKEKNK